MRRAADESASSAQAVLSAWRTAGQTGGWNVLKIVQRPVYLGCSVAGRWLRARCGSFPGRLARLQMEDMEAEVVSTFPDLVVKVIGRR